MGALAIVPPGRFTPTVAIRGERKAALIFGSIAVMTAPVTIRTVLIIGRPPCRRER
jgi:hypothetical protein